MHSDDNLNKALRKVKTATEVFTFFQQSHPYSKMLVLTMVGKGVNDDLPFSYQDVKAFVNETLPYLPEELIEAETKLILSTAEKTGYIRPISNGKYKIVSRHRSSDGFEADLRKRWVKYKMLEKLIEKVAETIEDIQIEFTKKREKPHH